MYVDIRIFSFEVAKQRRQHVFSNRGTCTDDQNAADLTGHIPYRILHLRIQIKDFIGILKHPFAGIRQADAVMGAIKQAGIEVFLQLTDLKSHRWLRHMQALCCLGKAQQAGNGVKNL